jgi:hypothetical protein
MESTGMTGTWSKFLQKQMELIETQQHADSVNAPRPMRFTDRVSKVAKDQRIEVLKMLDKVL